MRIYTVQMSNVPRNAKPINDYGWRTPDHRALFLDTTTRGKHPLFAPGWDIVMGHKNWVKAGRPQFQEREQDRSVYLQKALTGYATDEMYTEIYLLRMKLSYRHHKEAWQKVLQDIHLHQDDLVLICYCTPGEFCHRTQLAGMLKKVADAIGIPCELGGEWQPPKEPTIGLYLLKEDE